MAYSITCDQCGESWPHDQAVYIEVLNIELCEYCINEVFKLYITADMVGRAKE